MDKYIEFTNLQTGQIETQEVQHCFELAILAEPLGVEFRRGFCLGFQLPHKSMAECRVFWNKIYAPGHNEIYTAYFCEGKSRIPFYVECGNGYDEQYGSSCLWGYVNPCLFASTERPKLLPDKPHSIGAYIMGFYEGPDRAEAEKTE